MELPSTCILLHDIEVIGVTDSIKLVIQPHWQDGAFCGSVGIAAFEGISFHWQYGENSAPAPLIVHSTEHDCHFPLPSCTGAGPCCTQSSLASE